MDFNKSYIGERNDILDLVPLTASHVLDVGCSTGELGKSIKSRSKVEVFGIECNQQMAQAAKENLDKVLCVDIERIDLSEFWPLSYFDCIIFADVLEHTRDPWGVLKKIVPFLRDDGIIVISLPNVRHYSTLASLIINKRWPYRERGIHDRNHIRFFALQNIKEMIRNANLHIRILRRNYRIIERQHTLNKFSRFFALPLIKDLFCFQYLIVCAKL